MTAAHGAPRDARSAFPWLAAALLGALQTLAFVVTAAWPLMLACTAALAALTATASPRRAFALGWVYSLAWLMASVWWLFISMHRYGDLPAWLAALAVLALSAFLALHLGAALALSARWRRRQPARDALIFAACWTLAEIGRGWLFTGFPWAASGYALIDSPFARLAPFVGVYGLGAVAAGLAAWVGLAAMRSRRAAGVAALILVAVCAAMACAPAAVFTQSSQTLAVSLLQGNVPQDEKFESTHQGAALAWHIDALIAARGDLVVAPETAVPFLPQQMPEGFWSQLRTQLSDKGRPAALFGVPLGEETRGYTNSAVGFANGQPPYEYAKHHLVPFGEFIPQGFHWFVEQMNIPLGDFARGSLHQPSFNVRGERVAPNICYEDLFGEELAQRFEDQATAPTILANLSNIGWFGDTIAIDQHVNISRMRSLELQRPMLRATNTGATVVIDHRGVVTASLAPFTRGVLEGTVQGRVGITPYAWWSARFGLWAPLLLALVVIAVARRP